MNAQGDLLPAGKPTPPGNTPSWFTPLGWWLALEERLQRECLISGPFAFDPCAHPDSPVSRAILDRGGAIWTAEHDGLAAEWPSAPGWVNPPYQADELMEWGQRTRTDALREHHGGRVMLVPSWTDRAWWHRWIEPDRLSGRALVEFIKGRLTFGWPSNPAALSADAAKFASALVIWRGWR